MSCIMESAVKPPRCRSIISRSISFSLSSLKKLFASDVMPEFKERDEKLRTEKARRLEPTIEAALARRSDYSQEMPEDYVVEALPRQAIKAIQVGLQRGSHG